RSSAGSVTQVLCRRPHDFDPADVRAERLDLNVDPALRRQQRFDALRPLDDDYSAGLFQQLGKTDRLEIFAAADAVSVEVEDFEPAGIVDVEQDERRAADRVDVDAQTREQTADELRLSRAHLAAQRETLPPFKRSGQLRRDR